MFHLSNCSTNLNEIWCWVLHWKFKFTVFWGVTLCTLADECQHFREICFQPFLDQWVHLKGSFTCIRLDSIAFQKTTVFMSYASWKRTVHYCTKIEVILKVENPEDGAPGSTKILRVSPVCFQTQYFWYSSIWEPQLLFILCCKLLYKSLYIIFFCIPVSTTLFPADGVVKDDMFRNICAIFRSCL